MLDDVDVDLPAGAVVAIVGENGAGKTTLVKLLAKMYEPTEGRILVDGADLARMPADEWRARLAGAFQDFFRFELPARTDGRRRRRAAPRRRARGRDARSSGRGRRRGRAAAGGARHAARARPGRAASRCRSGQWQKLALARGFMRDEPLLLVLDEPTAALDAETEHALFERYAAAPRARRPATGASPSSCRTGSRPCAWPT